ncbi:MAG: SH3 domain-containing protein, partial [Anaerobacillus sp.]
MKTITSLILLSILLTLLPGKALAEKNVKFDQTVNVRSSPSLSSSVLTQVYRGDTLPVIKEGDEWIKVQIENGKSGWVASRLASPLSNHDNLEKIEVTVSNLQVRSGPGKEHDVLGSINQGTEWNVTEKENDWVAIDFKGKKGWVASWLVDPVNKQSSSHSSKKEVTARLLNVRESPGMDYGIVAQLPAGSVVEEIRKEGDWSLIRYNDGQTGWVDRTYLQGTTKTSAASYLSILYQATNLRSGPGMEYNIIKQASIHERYKIADKEGKWYRIILSDGTSAYVADWVVTTASQLSITPEVSSGKTVVLDAGHGGHDSGALGITTLEKILTLKTTTTIAEKLKNAGVQVILTRDSDTFISLSDRTALSDRYHADAFVSIHFDSTVDPTANGTTTYYYEDSDMSLAKAIHRKIGDDASLRDRGIRFGNYYVLRNNRQPSV